MISAAARPAAMPTWIEVWNPSRIFHAGDATADGDEAAQRLMENDNRVVRVHPALVDWNECSCVTAPANRWKPTTGK